MTKKPKTVLLDFDGVVIDSMPFHLEAWEKSFKSVFQCTLDKDVLSSLSGKSTKVIAQHLTKIENKPLLEEILIDKKLQFLQELTHGISLLPGAAEFIEELNSNNIPFGIVSNASRNFIKDILDQQQLDVPFYLGIEDYTKPKPHPQPYFMGAKKAGIEFKDYGSCFVFEDSFHGLKAAVDATMYGIGITSQHSAEGLKKAGAKLTFSSLEDALLSGLLR